MRVYMKHPQQPATLLVPAGFLTRLEPLLLTWATQHFASDSLQVMSKFADECGMQSIPSVGGETSGLLHILQMADPGHAAKLMHEVPSKVLFKPQRRLHPGAKGETMAIHSVCLQDL